jgi:hypothetical protein
MRGEPDRARNIFDIHMNPHEAGQPPLVALIDAVSLLWRMELAGCAHEASRWPALRSYALEKFPKAGMTYADLHSAIAFAVTGDPGSSRRLAEEVRAAAGRQWGAEIADPLMRGFEAFSRSDWSSAIEALAPSIDALVRIGGSRAQRDLVVHTLFAAYTHAGRTEEAKSLLASRCEHRPMVPGAGMQ